MIWRLAGFEQDGETKGGLIAFRIRPEFMPVACAPLDTSGDLFAEA